MRCAQSRGLASVPSSAPDVELRQRPSCAIAAGRYTSAATSSGRFPFLRRNSASLAESVVLPAPCKPTIISTVGPGLDSTSGTFALPSSSISSWLTILTTCWAGVRLLVTSSPIACSVTFATNSLTTLKLTSASSKARRTCFIASRTSSSVSLPLPPNFWKTVCRRSERLSNIVVLCATHENAANRAPEPAYCSGKYRLRQILRRVFAAPAGPETHYASGTRTSTVVPSPSTERMRQSPPISCARSRMLSRPSDPRVL